VLAGLALLWTASCAGFRGDDLPRLGLREAVGEEPLPAVTYTLTNTNAAIGLGPGRTGAAVERVFRRAFVDVQRVESRPGAGLHLGVHCTSRTRSPAFTVGLAVVSVLTLGVIPAYERNDHRLEVQVRTEGGVLKRYEYEDHVNAWLHLFMIPWAFSHDPVEVQEDSWENLLLHFLRDFRRDLPGSNAGGGTAGQG